MPRRDPPPKLIKRVPWQRVVHEVCDRKQRFDRADEARVRSRELEDRRLRVYRCPFSDVGERPHFHVGHVPNWRTVERIAAAIRKRAQDRAA
jgi:hypothetical protein